MLTQVRRKTVQNNIEKYSELRIKDWWNVDIVSYIRKYSYLGNQRYSKKRTNKSFVYSSIQTDFVVPYYQVGDTTYNLILCSSGSFIKGHKQQRDNQPQEMLITKSFLLGETEITQELYCAVMGVENPSEFQGNPKNPVERVSWYDALIFCNKLSDMCGLDRYYTITKNGKIIDTIETEQKNYKVETNGDSKGFRLPTEWEWEYAAKAGTQLLYSGSNDVNEVGWHYGNSKVNGEFTTHPVKQLNPNAWGFYDMSGNVWEWCEDKYKSTSAARVSRGGDWNHLASKLRSAFRDDNSSGARYAALGFRVCRYI